MRKRKYLWNTKALLLLLSNVKVLSVGCFPANTIIDKMFHQKYSTIKGNLLFDVVFHERGCSLIIENLATVEGYPTDCADSINCFQPFLLSLPEYSKKLPLFHLTFILPHLFYPTLFCPTLILPHLDFTSPSTLPHHLL